jgi:hypothetical protein
MMTTTFAAATPHALVVLTVSHGLLFRQPLVCDGTNAAVSSPKVLLAECRQPCRNQPSP